MSLSHRCYNNLTTVNIVRKHFNINSPTTDDRTAGQLATVVKFILMKPQHMLVLMLCPNNKRDFSLKSWQIVSLQTKPT